MDTHLQATLSIGPDQHGVLKVSNFPAPNDGMTTDQARALARALMLAADECDDRERRQAGGSVDVEYGMMTQCACGGEMDGEICMACGWWPGRITPPGEEINGVLCDKFGNPMLRVVHDSTPPPQPH